MTLDQLRIFIAVAEREHVTRAAEALNLTQSAVSAAVHALEARCGVKLFDRVGRRIELTTPGQVVLREAREVLDRAKAAEKAIDDLGAMRRGAVSVHASQTIANHWLPQRLVAFAEKFPAINMKLVIGNTADSARAVREGRAELGLVEGVVNDRLLLEKVIARDQLVVVVGPKHPWARMAEVNVEHFTSSAWALREQGSGTRSTFESTIATLGVIPSELRVALELPSNAAVCAAVEAGQFAGVVSDAVASPWVDLGRLTRIDVKFPMREFVLITHRERSMSKAAQALLDDLASQ